MTGGGEEVERGEERRGPCSGLASWYHFLQDSFCTSAICTFKRIDVCLNNTDLSNSPIIVLTLADVSVRLIISSALRFKISPRSQNHTDFFFISFVLIYPTTASMIK